MGDAARSCPNCGRANQPGRPFCRRCASPLPATGSAPSIPLQVERRLVTVLFCDLVGFTPMSERLDPEDVRDIQVAYFEQIAAQIERYGGTVEKYAGDAVLAMFGVPVAHEDDPERAVLCALAMQVAMAPVAGQVWRDWQVDLAIRVGVNTGEVVSGAWHASDRQDTAVTGDAVNTAARIQVAAEPGEVLVGAEAMRLSRRRIRYGERQALRLKGKSEAVPVYPALGVREQFGERWESIQAATPFVGREEELRSVLTAWKRARAGNPGFVTVAGDAGIGKSRLLSEALERITPDADVRVFRGRAVSYGQQISNSLVADLLRSLLLIDEQDTLDEVQARLMSLLADVTTDRDGGSQSEALDVLGEVLGLPRGNSLVARAAPEARRQVLKRSLRVIFNRLAARQPILLLLEDLHWLDPASEDVLHEVLRDVDRGQLLVLAAHRSGWMAPWSEWDWVERIDLVALDDAESRQLAVGVLDGCIPSATLEQYLEERAGGNPLFVEELLRALEETGGLVKREGEVQLVAGIADKMPMTLGEILLARLDRLEEEARTVAQVGSVIGRSFAVRLLARVMTREQKDLLSPLTSLHREDIAHPRLSSDPEYMFKHVLVREAAYGMMVRKRRRLLHLATARAIAALYSSDEYVETIAHHFSKTEEHAEAAEWLERAGDRAAAMYANESAIGYYEAARGRWETVGPNEQVVARLDEKLGGVVSTLGRFDEALALLGEAEKVYQKMGAREDERRVVARIGMAHVFKGTVEEGIERVRAALDSAEGDAPSPGLAALCHTLGYLCIISGRYEELLSATKRDFEVTRTLGDEKHLPSAQAAYSIALRYATPAQMKEAQRLAEEAIPLAEAVGDPEALALALISADEGVYLRGDFRRSRAYREWNLRVSQRTGNMGRIVWETFGPAAILFEMGDWEEARTLAERAMSMVGSSESPTTTAYACAHLGWIEVAFGKCEEGFRLVEKALEMSQTIGDLQALRFIQPILAERDILAGHPDRAVQRLEPVLDRPGLEEYQATPLLTFLAWARLEEGDLANVDRLLECARNRAAREGNRKAMVDILRVEGMARTCQQRWVEAAKAFAEGSRLARAMPYPYAEAQILYRWGLMLARQGATSESGRRLKEALAIFRRLGAEPYIERTEQVLSELSTA